VKIYKCCSPHELENLTRSGWELKEILSQDKATNHHHSAPAQVVNNNPNNSGYSSYQSGMTVPVESPVIVREPMFLLWKDGDIESREIQLENIIKNTNEKHKENLAEFDKVRKERDTYKEEADTRTKQLGESAKVQMQMTDAKRKLEGDLAKVQKAIGDLKYFEIVGGPVPVK